MRRTLTARRIAELVGGELRGDGDAEVDGVAPLDAATGTSLTFLAQARYASQVADSQGAVLLVTAELAHTVGGARARVIVKNPHEALLSLLPQLYHTPVRVPGVNFQKRFRENFSNF